MIILMHCGGMPFNGETLKTKSLGGSETAAYYVARELAKRGHRVTLFTNHPDEGVFDGVKYVYAGELSEHAPLGDRFHFYATSTPHDVCMIQRIPGAFAHRFASKINVAWLHDLAMYRGKGPLAGALWNIDAVLTVSEWHKRQVCEVYGLEPSLVRPVTNGVDLALYAEPFEPIGNFDATKFNMLYTSRPERGLEHLLRPGGIMERLATTRPDAHLYFCSYDNRPPQMEQYYRMLEARAEELPNVMQLPPLTKEHLSQLQRSCSLHVYPTEFEEVSCITAMEAMAAGLPFLSSDVGALAETCAGSGSHLIPLRDGRADEDGFVEWITGVGDEYLANMRTQQIEAAERYDWPAAAERFEKVFEDVFAERTKNPAAMLKCLIHESDYYAAERCRAEHGIDESDPTVREMAECYAFARDNKWAEHYAAYYEYEKNRGVTYGPESLEGNARYHTVADHLAGLPAGSTVLDYGCAHGHYTVNLAKRYPQLRFVGVDITESNIRTAREWAAKDGVPNAEFCLGSVSTEFGIIIGAGEWDPNAVVALADAILACEVLEHVAEPWKFVDVLAKYLKPTGKMICSTPFGPWEAQGYKEHWPWRAHVHHFEREDLYDCFGHHPDFKITAIGSGQDRAGEALGQYVFTFGKPTEASRLPNYERKLRTQNPRQTLSVCMIARDAELNLGRCLESVKGVADEIIVAVDENTEDATKAIAEKYGARTFAIKSPMEIGFDEARNLSIAEAKGDWILWIDADEVLYHPERLGKYLRQNQFSAYSIKQHHYSVEPAGIIKTDLPVRLFRNRLGVRFFGVVHEHPETELNKGVGSVMLVNDVSIGHYGYSTEEVRRARFNRNLQLLVRDRAKYPDRPLGKMLWIRDLAQMNRWEAEKNGGVVSEDMRNRAREGIALWEELLKDNQVRLLVDDSMLMFYTTLVETLGAGYDIGFKIQTSKLNGGINLDKVQPVTARFYSRDHAERLMLAILAEKTRPYDSKYY